MNDMSIIVGLGNPGTEYIDTRHNTGFKVIDSIAEYLKIEVKKRKFNARFGIGEHTDKKLILLKPWQFMNRSGLAVAAAMDFYRLDITSLMVITDDLALEPGRIRLRSKGSAGGHNGLTDIIEKLGTNQFSRCRIGIGNPDKWQDQVHYVLGYPDKTQKTLIDQAINNARDAVLCWVENGIETAMNKFNKNIE